MAIQVAATRIGLSLALVMSLVSCAPTYKMSSPASFSKYEHSRHLKLITPKGIKVKIRMEDNDPKASLEFWTEALELHMDKQGYILKEKLCFKTNAGLDGCTLVLVVPFGTKDWILNETIFVVENDIFLVEAAGPYDLYEKIDDELKSALLTFTP